jgi:putative transposase
VIEVLERVCSEFGYPASIRVDQGSEFISRDLDLWAYTRNLTLELTAAPFGSAGRASRPTTRSSKGWLCRPSAQRQVPGGVPEPTLVHEPRRRGAKRSSAKPKCEAWRRDYNEVRPHSAIGNKPPISLVNRSAAHGQPWPTRTG